MFMKKQNKKRGFTITELVIVISVIAILSAVMIPTFSGLISKSKDSAAVQDATNAYTEYLAEVDYTEETFDDDFIYEYDESRYVVIKDGKVQAESGSDKVFTKIDAVKALLATADEKNAVDEDNVDDYMTEKTHGLYSVAVPTP